MSAVATPSVPVIQGPPSLSGRRLLTAADLALLPKTLPGGDVCWELYNGEPVPKSPPGFAHSKIGARIVAELLIQGERRGFCEAGDECAVILRRSPDQVVGPDAVFVGTQSLPARLSPEGYLETIPELVVEVRSKNDTDPEVESKVGDYLKVGVVLIWVADPATRTVAVYRPGMPTTTLTVTDTLTAAPIIPGFALALSDLFRS